jgi:hypothetical protein
MDAGGRNGRDRRRALVRRARGGAVLLALTLVSAIAPASVAATSEDAASTHAYLTAIVNHDEAELANLPQSVAATKAVATRISGECPGILTGAPPHGESFVFGLIGPEAGASPSPRAIGEQSRQSRQRGDLELELAFALNDPQTQSDREATEVLIRALTPLKWSNPKITFLLRLSIAAGQEQLDFPAPPVCADMKAWVASGYATLSPTSKEIASRAEQLLKRALELLALSEQAHIQPLPKVLAPYENASDRALARRAEALARRLSKGTETLAAIEKSLKATVGLPTPKAPKVEPPKRKPPVIARGRTAAGGKFVVRAERLSRSLRRAGCTTDVTITEPSRPQEGLIEVLSTGGGTGRCLSRSHVQPEQAVHCNSGLLTIEADLLPTARSVVLQLSDNRTITSPAIRVPARLGGPAGLYYQVVRGPSPIPMSLTELDAQGRTLAVLKLPTVVECTKNPVKYFPGGIVRLAHASLPQGPSFTIRGERYRELGTVHFELKLEVSSEEMLFGGGSGDFGGSVEQGVSPYEGRAFEPKTSSGCQPRPYAIVYGLLKAPRDTVLARVSGTLVSLRKLPIPEHLHAGGVLAYGAFSPLPTELLIRSAHGRTIARQNLSQAAQSNTETCEGEAEGS